MLEQRDGKTYVSGTIGKREAQREPGIELPGGNWKLALIRRPSPGHMSAYLINNNTGQRYVVSYQNGRLSYLREYKPPTNIPKFVDEFIRTEAEKK
jgi:hypothetical protein